MSPVAHAILTSFNKGRTASGSVGLFPQSFTTSDPPEATPATPTTDAHGPGQEPVSPTILQTLREEPENTNGSPDPDPRNGFSPITTDGEVMHATMTDVQKAIEQLGRHDGDGSRSFSFASSHGEGDGDWTDPDSVTDTDGEVDGWHLTTRQRLAKNSRMVNEESAGPSTPMRQSVPPIEVELSDESEAEDDEPTARPYVESSFLRRHPHIPEEEEDDAQLSTKANTSNRSVQHEPGTPVMASDAYIVPSPGAVVDDLPTATLPEKSFLKERGQGPKPVSPEPDPTPIREQEPEVEAQSQPEEIPLPLSPPPVNGSSTSSPPSTPSLVASPAPAPPISPANGLLERTRTPVFQPGTPSSSMISIGIQQALGTPTKPQSPFQPPSSETPTQKSAPPSLPPSNPPVEWTVEEVVDWLKGKGIDQDTCDKFIGPLIPFAIRLRDTEAPLFRTRHYWRCSPRVRSGVAQDRNWGRCFW